MSALRAEIGEARHHPAHLDLQTLCSECPFQRRAEALDDSGLGGEEVEIPSGAIDDVERHAAGDGGVRRFGQPGHGASYPSPERASASSTRPSTSGDPGLPGTAHEAGQVQVVPQARCGRGAHRRGANARVLEVLAA